MHSGIISSKLPSLNVRVKAVKKYKYTLFFIDIIECNKFCRYLYLMINFVYQVIIRSIFQAQQINTLLNIFRFININNIMFKIHI